MEFYIQIWPNNTATLVSDDGQSRWNFPTVERARQACADWYQALDEFDPLDDDGQDLGCASCAI